MHVCLLRGIYNIVLSSYLQSGLFKPFLRLLLLGKGNKLKKLQQIFKKSE